MAQMIELTSRNGLDYLHGLLERGQDMRPLLLEIGEDLTESTKQRFSSATGPDGTAWAPNSALTLARYSSMFARKKDGDLTKRSAQKLAGKKPLTGETRALATTINYQVRDVGAVGIGSPMVYAATQQHGAKSGEFGFGLYTTRVGSFPIPWGDIPARPFLGASDSDKANIVSLVQSYLMEG
ncbi:phage virion morphogenesis protein [Acidovorax sp. SUPP2522]|uniref:phage virion morphogenesis protein n=1 Tax=unclassified Acidovorax TaxID=2684926 RepID=UPI00234B2EE3|nr:MULTISPECIES: phage virion morphogenesis protein [unclassified Acidovorax]WCM96537.1 phage virion morphogenesis protein [Acidovorax sp. GBBC 1281]GKT18668.1 phage virion morphogenesis protein [Acidovorax sp. SUPP2522]